VAGVPFFGELSGSNQHQRERGENPKLDRSVDLRAGRGEPIPVEKSVDA